MAEHPYPAHKNEAILWAQSILSNKDQYLILDTETTGLGDNDVIVQMAIINLDGEVLMDELIKPSQRKRISSDAVAIHGITMKSLSDKPHFRDLLPLFEEIIKDKVLLIYNAEYDERLITQTVEQDEIYNTYISFQTECVILEYSKFKGVWNDYRQDYKWQRLPSADHSALGDCLATLKVIQKMAETKISIPPAIPVQIPVTQPPVSTLIESDFIPAAVQKTEVKKKWWQFWK